LLTVPELFITPDEYDSAMDMWSIGCLIHELLAPGAKPLFNKSHRLQLETILSIIGSPSDAELRNALDDAGRWHLSKLRTQRNKHPLPLEKRFGGTVDVSIMNPLLVDLMGKLLVFTPAARLNADQALRHPFLEPGRDPSLEPVIPHDRAVEIAALEPEPRNHTSLTREELRRQLWDEVSIWHPEEAAKIEGFGAGPRRSRALFGRR
jgi:mitogen-activated protein kinase 1/2